MLTRSSFSKSAARQSAGHPTLGSRVGSGRLPEHDLGAEGARAADAPLAGHFPAFPAFAPVRRGNFRRSDRGERGNFPLFALVRYPLSGTDDNFQLIKIGALAARANGFPAVYRRFRPFVWQGRVQSRQRIKHLAVPPFLSPFKNGENGGNVATSSRKRASTKIHPALGGE